MCSIDEYQGSGLMVCFFCCALCDPATHICPEIKHTLPRESDERKQFPLHRGLMRYFPAALAAVARVSKIGNDKHNPGEEMHHARGKSMDHADCILRHLMDMEEGSGYDDHGVPEVAYVAWRALALCQEWLEQHERAPVAPGSKGEDRW